MNIFIACAFIASPRFPLLAEEPHSLEFIQFVGVVAMAGCTQMITMSLFLDMIETGQLWQIYMHNGSFLAILKHV